MDRAAVAHGRVDVRFEFAAVIEVVVHGKERSVKNEDRPRNPMTLAWIAQRLHIDAWTQVSNLLRFGGRGK